MQPGEGRAKMGTILDRVLKTQTTDVQYRIWYCPTCLCLHRKVLDLDLPDEHET